MTGYILETMLCEVEGPLARLRLNRPEALNAANQAWVNDLVSATEYLADQSEVRVVIVSGEGSSFCSGLDVKELAAGALQLEWFATWERGVMGLAELEAITIASIHGYCLGGGLQLALACDLQLASTNAVLSIPAVREGLIAALGPMRLARQIGAGPAKKLALLGRRFTAAEGLAFNLLAEVVPPEHLAERTMTVANELLAIPFPALKHTKRQIDAAFEIDSGTLLGEFLQAQEECLRSPEHKAVMALYQAREAERQRLKQGEHS